MKPHDLERTVCPECYNDTQDLDKPAACECCLHQGLGCTDCDWESWDYDDEKEEPLHLWALPTDYVATMDSLVREAESMRALLHDLVVLDKLGKSARLDKFFAALDSAKEVSRE